MSYEVKEILMKLITVCIEKELNFDMHPSTCLKVYKIADGEYKLYKSVYCLYENKYCLEELIELLEIVNKY